MARTLSEEERGRTVSTWLPEDLIEWIDDKVEQGIFSSRSHALKVAAQAMEKRGALGTLEELREDP